MQENKTQTPTLQEWLDEWLITYKACAVSESTYDIYRFSISLICRYPIAAASLSEVTERDLQQCLNKLHLAKYSKSSIFKVRLVLRQSFSVAARIGLIPASPATELILPAAPTKEVLPLTHAEQALIEAACLDDPLGHLILFLLDTGLRRAELENLRWTDYVDAPDGAYIHVRASKTKAGIRTVYLISRAKEIIDKQPRINAYIFNSMRKTPLTHTVMRDLCYRVRQKARVANFTPHVCRHTFVTRLCEQGVAAKAIAQIIGHAKADYVLDIYATLEKQELRRAIYILDNPTA